MAVLKQLWTSKSNSEETRTTYQYVIDLRSQLESVNEIARATLTRSAGRYKKHFDTRARDRKFQTGDKVLVLKPTSNNKLLMQWVGPFRVLESKGTNDYVIDLDGKNRLYHANMLRLFHERDNDVQVEECGAAVLQVSDGEESTLDLLRLQATETASDVDVCNDLSEQQKMEVKQILSEYGDVLTDLPGCTKLEEHTVRMTSHTPIRKKPYPIPFHAKEAMRLEIDKMVKMGVIEPSNSPFCSPVVLVEKKDKSLRFCVDYREVNKATVFDCEPMTRIDDLFAQLSNSRFLTQIDLSKGFWQIPMASDAKEVTAFSTDVGHWHFTRMPFGMVNAPATLNRLVRKVLNGSENAFAYMDDIVIATKDWESHVVALKDTLGRLRKAGLTARPSKMKLGFAVIDCLGHKLGNGKITPCSDKVRKIQDMEVPQTKRQLRSFLGMVGFYSRYIPNFAAMAAPLTDKTKKGNPNHLSFDDTELRAFALLKAKLCEFSVLRLPNFELPFVVQTDASDIGIGAILLQEESGVKFPVVYASRKLSSAERNYSVIEKECLAIVWALEKFHQYLYGKCFYLETDHKPLAYLQKARFGLNSRLIRWALQLQSIMCYIRAIPGSQNAGADCLSRL